MKKKLISAILCAAMGVTMLAGCGSTSSSTSTDTAATTAASSETTESSDSGSGSIDNSDITIGVSIWSSTDTLGSQCKLILDEAAKALGVNVQYVDQGHVSEQVTASVEQLCAAGCQGIIICNSADTEMQSAISTCDSNGVYLAQFFRIISEENSPEIYEQAKNSAYYVGAVHEDEVDNGEKLVNILIDKGYRDIGLIGWTQGDATFLGRWEGYQAGVEAWNEEHPDDPVTLSDPQYAGTTSEGGAQAAQALMEADPNLDALIAAGGGGDPFKGALSAIENAGKVGEIGIVSTDFVEDLEERLENGSISGESGGHYCDPLFAFLMVYNAIKGNYTGFEGEFNEMLFPYLFVSSPEDYADYEKYFVDQLPYTDDEIVEMSNMSLADLTVKCSELSIADAAARAGN